MTHNFTGKHVLVTGASRGIGYAIAEAFAEHGADLTVLAEGADIAEAAERLSDTCGRSVAALRCDIADRAAVAETVGGLQKIDVLINNAGLELITPLLEPGPETEATFRRIVEINVVGSYYVTREAVPKMPAGGRIVFTASVWGKSAVAEFSAYCASKHAIIGFMRSMAHELAPRGITVNAVCPGWVRTEASMRSLAAMAKRVGRAEDDLLEEIMSTQAIGGLMEPLDVTSPYLYLASAAAANVTGQALSVDRGEVMA